MANNPTAGHCEAKASSLRGPSSSSLNPSRCSVCSLKFWVAAIVAEKLKASPSSHAWCEDMRCHCVGAVILGTTSGRRYSHGPCPQRKVLQNARRKNQLNAWVVRGGFAAGKKTMGEMARADCTDVLSLPCCGDFWCGSLRASVVRAWCAAGCGDRGGSALPRWAWGRCGRSIVGAIEKLGRARRWWG